MGKLWTQLAKKNNEHLGNFICVKLWPLASSSACSLRRMGTARHTLRRAERGESTSNRGSRKMQSRDCFEASPPSSRPVCNSLLVA